MGNKPTETKYITRLSEYLTCSYFCMLVTTRGKRDTKRAPCLKHISFFLYINNLYSWDRESCIPSLLGLCFLANLLLSM